MVWPLNRVRGDVAGTQSTPDCISSKVEICGRGGITVTRAESVVELGTPDSGHTLSIPGEEIS
jgi:hypothetical protein